MPLPWMDEKRQCTAMSKRSRERCTKAKVKGSNVCATHGAAAPQVKAKAMERVKLAEALERGDRRHPWEVLLDTVHAADVLMREARVTLAENETLTPDQIDNFVRAVDRAAKMAQTAITARAHEWAARQATDHGTDIALIVNAAIHRADIAGGCEDRLRQALRSVLTDVANGGMDALQRQATGEARYRERLLNAPQIEGTMLD